ncbi:hypothetical protein [Caldimonas brevitalea]|uniref:Uncharacterized protein n=1 Tax=Caldimonas brevitalea TaxID=413882 RepID=A0A0G3BKY2_9BURK|nr:hypothetical protein [Caldimonas brevitalea]AKJ27200.1 hypothetical protein AAW51_0509 [Caldimonas brevitalea]
MELAKLLRWQLEDVEGKAVHAAKAPLHQREPARQALLLSAAGLIAVRERVLADVSLMQGTPAHWDQLGKRYGALKRALADLALPAHEGERSDHRLKRFRSTVAALVTAESRDVYPVLERRQLNGSLQCLEAEVQLLLERHALPADHGSSRSSREWLNEARLVLSSMPVETARPLRADAGEPVVPHALPSAEAPPGSEVTRRSD